MFLNLYLIAKVYNIVIKGANVKILIIEDNFQIADSYRNELKKSNIISDITGTYSEGIKKIKSGDYDLVLLDINLPDGSGVDLLKEIRQSKVESGIIMVTARTEDELLIDSLDFGADDYLQKPVKYKELISRVNAVGRRMQNRTSSNLVLESIEINYAQSIVTVGGEVVKMTNKEFLILSKIASTYPGYVSTEQLNYAINDEYEISSASIRVHIYNLKKKLKGHNITIDNSKNLGYVLCFRQ